MGARRGGSFRALALAVLIVLAATVALTVENVFPFPLDTGKTVQSQAELELDENGHLKRNYLLYLDTPSCPQLTEVVWNMRFNMEREALQLSHKSEFARQLFGADYMSAVVSKAADPASQQTGGSPCAAVCLDMGAPRDLVAFPLENKVFRVSNYTSQPGSSVVEDEEGYQTELEYAHFVSAECQGVEVGWVNWSNRTATIYWVNQHNELAPVGRLEGQVGARVRDAQRGRADQ